MSDKALNIQEAATSLRVDAWKILVWMERAGWVDRVSTQTVFGIAGRQDKVRVGWLVNATRSRQNRRSKATVNITANGLTELQKALPSIIASGEDRS